MLMPVYLYLPMLFACAIVALNLLHLKKWSRVAIIFLSLLFVAESVIIIPTWYYKIESFVTNKFSDDGALIKAVQEIKKERKIKEIPISDEEMVELTRYILRMGLYFVLLLPGLISLVFNTSVICYFARPRIKGHFI